MTVQNIKRLAVIDGETLMDARLPKRSFCVETLLPEGISMLGGAPKVGTSWMVLFLALQVAKGEPLWNLPTKQGTVLYLALEDSQSRLQDRLNRLTEKAFRQTQAEYARQVGKLNEEYTSLVQRTDKREKAMFWTSLICSLFPLALVFFWLALQG